MPVPVTDLFAGPGGLGEGFSSQAKESVKSVFQIKLTIKKNAVGDRTRLLRAFFRHFPSGQVLSHYYDYLLVLISGMEKLFEIHPREAVKAVAEAWNT